jgi:hypothetical protein
MAAAADTLIAADIGGVVILAIRQTGRGKENTG